MPFLHDFNIGPLLYDRSTNVDLITNQCILQCTNPLLPHHIKQLINSTLQEINLFEGNFHTAPVHTHNLLVLKLKACLAFVIGGATLANYQIEVARCYAANEELPDPPLLHHNLSHPAAKLPSKRRISKQCIIDDSTSSLREERFDSDMLSSIPETPLQPSTETNEPSINEEQHIASLLELPEPLRDAAIRQYFINRKTKPAIPTEPRIEVYNPCCKPISTFNRLFPLGKIYNRWKHGIPIYPTTNHSVGRIRKCNSPIHDKVIQELLKGNIIEPAPKRSSAFMSNFFLVPKDNNTAVRPIFDYSHLTKHLKSPHFVLPSIFQLVKRKPWPTGLFYIKFDFSAAFFNIPIKKSSRFITTFSYNNNTFILNKLPFGISIAPFVCQRFMNAIVDTIKPSTQHVWAHIDDLIIAHHDSHFLQQLAESLIRKFTEADWKINLTKSIIKPSQNIIFLGAIWSQTGVTRLDKVTLKLKLLWQAILFIKLKEKPLQRIRGLFNYYFQFAGNFHSVLNKILKTRNKSRYNRAVQYLLSEDFISFKQVDNRKTINIHSDASLFALGVYFLETKKSFTVPSFSSILFNELKAAILAINLFNKNYDNSLFKPHLFVDNINVLYLINKGSCKWSNIDPLFLFYVLKFFFINCIKVSYVHTSQNLADKPSRLKHCNFPQ